MRALVCVCVCCVYLFNYSFGKWYFFLFLLRASSLRNIKKILISCHNSTPHIIRPPGRTLKTNVDILTVYTLLWYWFSGLDVYSLYTAVVAAYNTIVNNYCKHSKNIGLLKSTFSFRRLIKVYNIIISSECLHWQHVTP